MSFNVKSAITDEAMGDIVTTGFESGGYGSVAIDKFVILGDKKPTPPKWADYPECRHCWWWADGEIRVADNHGDDTTGVISRATLQKGLDILAEKYPHLLADLVSGSYDVIPADALLQCAAFGDLIYG